MKICDDLRQAVLQAAIQGKLTTQRPDDGDARELLKQIQKSFVLKQSKIEINTSAMDFNIPDNWAFVELNQLYEFVDYRGKTPNKSANGIPLVTASNIKKGFMDYTRKEYISEDEYNSRLSRGVTELGDILFTTEAPMGNIAICELKKCSCGQRVITFKQQVKNTLSNKFFMYSLLSNAFENQLKNNATGTTAKGIKAEKLKHFLVPLPPLAEQHRIVAKVEKLMEEIDELEKVENELHALKTDFPGDMKAALLQAAMQGKLTTQRKEDGDARDLLKQIAKEKAQLIKEKKIKKEKPLPEIAEDEIPFDVPENWVWVRLNYLVYNPGQIKPNSDFCYIDIGSIDNKKQVLSKEENIISAQDAPSRARKIVKLGDIIYSTVRPYLHNMAIIDKEFSLQPIASTGFAVLSCCKGVFNKYLFCYLLSPYFDEYANNIENAKGVAYPAINDEKLYKAVIPLPPLAEQYRIVAKLEKLLPLCDGLVEE